MKNKKKKYYIFSLDMLILNIFSFFLLFIFIGLTLIIDKNLFIDSVNYVFEPNKLILIFCLIVGYMILHELFHSLGYFLYGGKFKKIVYGIELEKGIFYCLCKQNINKRNILNSLFFPLFYIGIITYIIGLIFEMPYLLILSIFNISGCAGDVMMFIFAWKLDNDIQFSEFDDSTSFAIYSIKDISKYKHFGLKYIGVTDKIIREDLRKVKISKMSYIILSLLLILCILALS